MRNSKPAPKPALKTGNNCQKIKIAQNNIASLDYAQGRLADARRGFEALLPTDRKSGNQSGLVIRLNNLSAVASAQGAYDEALQFAQEECELQATIGSKPGQAACKARMLTAQIGLNRDDDARATLAAT